MREFKFTYKVWNIRVKYDPLKHKRGVLRIEIAHAIESGRESSRADGGRVIISDDSLEYEFERNDKALV